VEAVEVRAFFAIGEATVEDPVTGSLNAALAPWLVSTGVTAFPFTARQGTALGRHGRVHLSTDADGTVWVGGSTTTVVVGSIAIPTPRP
jgi:PhzF family phenazine biosynthesis protein